ncbi:hypothetical protein HY633_00260 [Candidatus Uhrbacteria bacterium]|nr:hypothetical protein [Candidatus Uhrbacteria bacterium]
MTMTLAQYRRRLRLAVVIAVVFGLAYLLWHTLIPGGSLTVTTDLVHPAPFVSEPKPQGRLADDITDDAGRTLSPLIHHPLYLDLTPPSRFDRVRMTVRYLNTGHGQIELGALASSLDEQYAADVVEQRLIDTLPWSRVESNGLVLLQRVRRYDSIDAFLRKPPDRRAVAATDNAVVFPTRLDIPAGGDSRTIEVSLRGQHRLITYADGAPLALSFIVQDMNRETGEDPVIVSVYRLGESKPLTRVTLDDDGNIGSDQHSSKLRTVSASLSNPAAGAYQIEFTASADIFIRKIVTRQTKLVFAEKIYLGDLIGYSDNIRPRTVIASGRRLIARTAHTISLQTLAFDGNTLIVDEPNTRFMRDLAGGPAGTAVRVPKGDLLLETDGVFALTPGDLFEPLPYRIQWDTAAAELQRRGIEYVLARYHPPQTVDGLTEASAEFDLRRLALTRDGDYRFVIGAPGIDESQQEVRIASVAFTLLREPLGFGNLRSSLAQMFEPPVSASLILPDGHSFGERLP